MSAVNNNSFPVVKQGASLTAYAPDEKPWDTHRSEAQTMEGLLRKYADDERIKHLLDRIAQCSPWLIFAHTTPDERNRTFKLHETTFCRVRTCPVCQWRRSLRHVARFLEALPKIAAEYPNHRWLHLTLTVKNCPVENLRETIVELNKSWKRLMNLKSFKTAVLGYVRNIEVTRSADGSAHPHMHILLVVPASYFKKSSLYIRHDEWREMWRDSARLDYDPQVGVRAIKKTGDDTEREVREVMKYATKPEHLLEDAEWLVQYIYQVHNLRFLSAGGLVKKHLSTEEVNEDEMIVPGQEDVVDDSGVLALTRFNWHRKKAGYYAKETKVRPATAPAPAPVPAPAPAPVPAPVPAPAPAAAPWEAWGSEPIRRGDWEAEKKAYDDKRAKELLDEIRSDTGGTLEGLLRATGNSWARNQSYERKQVLYELAQERRKRKT